MLVKLCLFLIICLFLQIFIYVFEIFYMSYKDNIVHLYFKPFIVIVKSDPFFFYCIFQLVIASILDKTVKIFSSNLLFLLKRGHNQATAFFITLKWLPIVFKVKFNLLIIARPCVTWFLYISLVAHLLPHSLLLYVSAMLNFFNFLYCVPYSCVSEPSLRC